MTIAPPAGRPPLYTQNCRPRARSCAARATSKPFGPAHQMSIVERVHELDAVTMGEAMVGSVKIAAVVALGLAALVIHHRVDAVFVRQREVEQLELDRQTMRPAVSIDSNRPAVRAGRTIAPG